jgi:hypothetical protein
VITSTVGTDTCRHTITVYTWRELAAEQLAPVLARIPELRPRRITFVRRGTVAA